MEVVSQLHAPTIGGSSDKNRHLETCTQTQPDSLSNCRPSPSNTHTNPARFASPSNTHTNPARFAFIYIDIKNVYLIVCMCIGLHKEEPKVMAILVCLKNYIMCSEKGYWYKQRQVVYVSSVKYNSRFNYEMLNFTIILHKAQELSDAAGRLGGLHTEFFRQFWTAWSWRIDAAPVRTRSNLFQKL
jgi:hypothetical protein